MQYSIWGKLRYGGYTIQYKIRRKLLSQNFLYNQTLINFLVRKSSIGSNDMVLEIGPGKGFITAELLQIAKKVTVVERDEKLVLHLKQFLEHYPNLEICQEDFQKFSLPKYYYKVFANIPFSIESVIVRKLLNFSNSPADCYLIVDKRFASRLSGIPHENQFSLKHKPWFDFSVYHHFKKSDFIPAPHVDSVMWRITRKNTPLLPVEERTSWEKFIELMFGQGQPVKNNLRKILTSEQIIKLQQSLGFSLKLKPSYLSLDQQLKLYKSLEY